VIAFIGKFHSNIASNSCSSTQNQTNFFSHNYGFDKVLFNII